MAIIRRGEGQVTRSRGWDPFEMLQDMVRWEPFRELARGQMGELAFAPSFDVKETKDAYVFKADLPGIKQEDVDIALTGNRLTISGKRQEEKRNEGEVLYTYERSYGEFSRSFTLPQGIDPDQVRAEMKDGVLTVAVPKKPEVQPRRIQLNKGEGAKA